MATEAMRIHQPTPRRYFNHEALPAQPPSPQLLPLADSSPSRAQSYLNLTSSTLLGIYAPAQSDDEDDDLIDQQASGAGTPWGTGVGRMQQVRGPANLPRLATGSPMPSYGAETSPWGMVLRSVLLSTLGMLYGLLIRHLHDHRRPTLSETQHVTGTMQNWGYLAFWGVAGLGLGSLMPWIDRLWARTSSSMEPRSAEKCNPTPVSEPDTKEGLLIADWTPVVRSVGAFVGIAFAIRKLPWTSPLQASLTLFLVNPVLWYIIDRSGTGFALSATVGGVGTVILMASYPQILPSPLASAPIAAFAGHSPLVMHGLLRKESMESAVWILSVLFCSCVCFGNIGRRLALIRHPHRPMNSPGRNAHGRSKTYAG